MGWEEVKRMAKGRKTKRVVAISDMHCGHRVGMTPPQFQLNPDNENDAKWLTLQKEQWKWYCKVINSLRPIDLLLVLGDCVDGRNERAAGRDCIRPGRRDQVDMAFEVIQFTAAPKIAMVYGTRYHVADWEDDLCSNFGDRAKIGSHEWPEVNGVVFDIKHKVGSSIVPYGRPTSVMRARLWNTMWSESARQPNSDILLRGHVHYHVGGFSMCGGKKVWAMTLPALQGIGTEYGAEQCEGLVDFGLVHFDITPGGSCSWDSHVAVLPSQVAVTSQY